MIALVADSNAQLPSLLIDRYDIQVVPLTVTVDGVDHLEGVDIEVDAFYDLFTRGTAGPPQVTTSQPSPGLFGEAYARAATRGAEAILSIHIGSEVSGTLNSARIAAATSEVPVRLVDPATACFATGCCVWEAAEALAAGADLVVLGRPVTAAQDPPALLRALVGPSSNSTPPARRDERRS